jgi:hypothetical protein
MDKREFFENVLSYFLVACKFDCCKAHSISDYSFKKNSNDLEFRSSNSKIMLDSLNPISSPIILGFKDMTKDIRVLPPMNNWDCLTLSIGNNLTPINLSLKKMILTEIPVVDLDDLKVAINSGNLSIPIYLAKLDLSNKSNILNLKRILLKKLDVSIKN